MCIPSLDSCRCYLRDRARALLTLNARGGTCQLKLHASGKWVEENDFVINIAPDMIRDMLGLVIEQCVQGGDGGGVVYNAINNTINWLLREDVDFPGGPPRVPGGPRDLYIRESHPFRRTIPSENRAPPPAFPS